MKKINYNISNISPIQLGEPKFNNKSNKKEKKEIILILFQLKRKIKMDYYLFHLKIKITKEI